MNSVSGNARQQPNQAPNIYQPLYSAFNQTSPTFGENNVSRYNMPHQANFAGQQPQSKLSLGYGDSSRIHLAGVQSNKLHSQPSQFIPAVSHYLSSNVNAYNGSVPSFSQKSSGLTSTGRLMSLAGNSDGNGRERKGMGETLGSGNGGNGNCSFTTNGNGIIGEAVPPSRQIMNPQSPKGLNSQLQSALTSRADYTQTLPSTKPMNDKDHQNDCLDIHELRLRTYQENNKPSRDDKKVELADSMAQIGGGIGIVPGQNPYKSAASTPRSGRYRDRDFQKSYSTSMYPFVNGKNQSQSLASINTNKDQTSTSMVSRAQDIIGKVKSEIGKTNSLINLRKEGAAYGEHSEEYWLTMGVPQFEDNLGDKYTNRAKQQEYRQALELQIRQKEERRVLEQRKDREHPLGGSHIENALSFGPARLGQYPNLRLPRNNFSQFENSVIHKSAFSKSGNKLSPLNSAQSSPSPNNYPPVGIKPDLNQGHNPHPQNNYTAQAFQQPNRPAFIHRPFLPPFYPHPLGSQPPQGFPMHLPPQVPLYPYPMQTPQNPWQAYPYQHQYLQQNHPQLPMYQQSHNMPQDSDVRVSEQWRINQENIVAPTSVQIPSQPSTTEPEPQSQSCCIMPQKANLDCHKNEDNPAKPLLTQKHTTPAQQKPSSSNLEGEIDFDQLKEDDYEQKTKLKVWQTSDQLPNPDLKMAYWKAELKRQIDEKRQKRRIEETEVIEAEKRLDKRIQEHLEAERRELQGKYTKEQHKLNMRGNGQNTLDQQEKDLAWRLGGGDDNSVHFANAHENRILNNNGRKFSPPVPASQRCLQENRQTVSDSGIFNRLIPRKSHLQTPSASDPSFLNYLVRALENETGKQEKRLRNKLQRNNK